MPDSATLEIEREVGVDDIGGDEPLVVEEVLVEEISIDGMCGVY